MADIVFNVRDTPLYTKAVSERVLKMREKRYIHVHVRKTI